MRIRIDPALSISEDAFGAKIVNGELHVPHVLIDAAGQGNNVSLEILIVVLHDFPTTFAESFNWTSEQFQRAMASLARLLHGKVSDEILQPNPHPPIQHGMGALAPPGAEVQDGYVVPRRK